MSALSTQHVVWSSGDPSAPLVLLLHGYGSHEGDLAGLIPALPGEFRYAAMRAPIDLGGGFAWFPLSIEGGQLAARGGRAAAASVADWLRLTELSPVGAIGFSQGGAMALELLREHAVPTLAWAAVLSGFVLEPEPDADGIDPRDAGLEVRKPPVFWGRGDHDSVITPELTARTLRWLPKHATLHSEVYRGLAHSVSFDEVQDLSAWMRKRLTS